MAGSLPVLRVIEFDRVPVRLGEVWTMTKDGKTLTCSLFNHAIAPWELRLELGSELIRSEACRTEKKVFDVADEWRIASAAKGWEA
jgi:hypothetical protein